MAFTLISLGCYNKALYTGWLINSNFFLVVMELGSLRSGCQNSWVPVKTIQFADPVMAESRERDGSLPLLIGILVPTWGLRPHDLIIFEGCNTMTLGVRV